MSTTSTFINTAPHKIALEWTYLEHRIVRDLQESEFESVAWLKPNSPINSPNITRLIDLSNKLTYFIITEILRPETPQGRATMLKYFLKMGAELIQLKNFSAASVLTLAVQHPSVLRLTSTWELVTDPDSLNALNNLKRLFLNPLQNPRDGYKDYWNLQNSIVVPYVPFFRIILEELANEGTLPDEPTLSTRAYQCQVKNNRILGEREAPHNLTRHYLDIIMKAKEGSYLEPKEFVVWQTLDHAKIFTNEEAYERSKQLEPKQSSIPVPETDHFDYLPYIAIGLGLISVAGFWYLRSQK